MRRTGFRKPATQMSLFPFLAVLICTMGVLIVLLVLLVQAAQDSAERESATDDEQEMVTELTRTAEDGEWLFDQLAAERDRLRESIAEQAAALEHLEGHLRDLDAQAEQVREELRALAQLDQRRAQSLQAIESQKAALRDQIEQARRELEAARERLRRAKPAYAIVPYLGPNGTHRRPVYIECTGAGLVIQPEGIVLTESDFGGLIGPGNPLDAALRAIRDYYRRAGLGGVPYPLLIVRPEGTESYAMARAAMRSWNDEFGYELVEADRELRFPSADAALADLLRTTIAQAKARQAALAAAMPAAYGRKGGGPTAFVASRSGGFVPVDRDQFPLHRHGGAGHGGSSRSGRGRPGERREEGAAAGRGAQRPTGPQALDGRGTASAAQATGSGSGGASGAATPGQRRRGDWAIPEHHPGAVAITRPISVELSHDKLVLVREPGDARSRTTTIRLSGPLAAHTDAIVSAVWDRMESWGLAVLGGYWKPVLSVRVAPGAERRFLELQRAFRNSGLTVERRMR